MWAEQKYAPVPPKHLPAPRRSTAPLLQHILEVPVYRLNLSNASLVEQKRTGTRSRELMRQAADRLSILWYLGYNPGEPLPDHSSLTRIRARYGVEVFRRFFDEIVDQCQHAGLVWGKELYADARHPSWRMRLSPHSPRALPLKLI